MENSNIMTNRDMLDNDLVIFEPHTDDPHQKIRGPISDWSMDLMQTIEPEYDEDIADQYNNLDFSDANEYFFLDDEDWNPTAKFEQHGM